MVFISCFDLLLAITVAIIVLPSLVIVVVKLGVVAIALLMGFVITRLAVTVIEQILAIRIAQKLLIVTRVNPIHLQIQYQISNLLLVLHFCHKQSMLQLPYVLEIYSNPVFLPSYSYF